MSETPQFLAARLRSEAEKTLEFFRTLPADAWERCVYTEGAQWSVRQVLAHQVAAEAGMLELLQNILAGGEGVPADFDLNRYNERRVERMEAAGMDDLLAHFTQARQASAALIDALAPADLDRPGRHPWLGETTVLEIVKLMYRHNQIHQREIRHALAAE